MALQNAGNPIECRTACRLMYCNIQKHPWGPLHQKQVEIQVTGALDIHSSAITTSMTRDNWTTSSAITTIILPLQPEQALA
jgi:hypothetical protein